MIKKKWFFIAVFIRTRSLTSSAAVYSNDGCFDKNRLLESSETPAECSEIDFNKFSLLRLDRYG